MLKTHIFSLILNRCGLIKNVDQLSMENAALLSLPIFYYHFLSQSFLFRLRKMFENTVSIPAHVIHETVFILAICTRLNLFSSFCISTSCLTSSIFLQRTFWITVVIPAHVRSIKRSSSQQIAKMLIISIISETRVISSSSFPFPLLVLHLPFSLHQMFQISVLIHAYVRAIKRSSSGRSSAGTRLILAIFTSTSCLTSSIFPCRELQIMVIDYSSIPI